VETCKVKKKEEPIITTIKATNQLRKGENNNSYVCHIYGLNGHKIINCPKFVEILKMFQGENASSAEGKVIVEVKTIITNVNVATRNRITKDHVF
jgi:hypothetical protein